MSAQSTFDSFAGRVRLRVLRGRAVAGPVASPIAAGDALSHVALDDRAPRRVTLVTPTVSLGAVFAGLRTAFDVAGAVARDSGGTVRVLTLDAPRRPRELAAARSSIATLLGLGPDRVEVSSAWAATDARADEVWIATYYATAHALDRAAARGVVDRGRVLYLVQDHEPDFFPASVERAVAEDTYRAGFRLLVNSEPLRRYLVARGTDVTPAHTFRPALDVEALRRTAAARAASATTDPASVSRIGFYARPSKPRNAFATGRAALQIAGRRLRDLDVPFRVVTLGEQHAPFTVPGGRVDVLGRLAWDESFRALGDIDVLLSLQLTPHPSHPPLDQVASGGTAVTNELDGTRSGLGDRLLTAPASPELLAEQIVAGTLRARQQPPAPFDDAFLRGLGRPLEDAVHATTAGIR